MAKGIEIGVGVDTKAAKQGLEAGLIQPLENAQEALEDLGRDRGPEQLERGLRDAQEASEKLQRETRQTAETIEREFREAYRTQRREAQHAGHASSEVMGEVKQEALQNAAETFSSFDGSARSFVDGLQGTFGGLVASLGAINPALLPIGIAGAAAVGLISSAITNSDEKTQAFKERVAELTEEFLDTGTVGRRSMSSIVDELQEIVTQTDESKTNLDDLQKIADTLKVPIREAAYAYVQGGDALDALIDRHRDLQDAEDERYREALQRNPNNILYGVDTQRDLDEVNRLLGDQKKALDAAADAADLAADAGLTSWQLKRDVIDQVNDAYDDGASAVADYINKESGLFNVAAYIESMQKREQALKDYQTAIASTDLSPEALKFLSSQGQEAAASFVQGYKDATPEQRAELNRIWTQAGKDDSGAYSKSLDAAFEGASVTGPTVSLQPPNLNAFLSALQRDLNQQPLTVPIKPDRLGHRIL